jgi:hypothetical protein
MDYLSSLLISYHHLCTGRDKELDGITITPEEGEYYIQFAKDMNIIIPNHPFNQHRLQFPQYDTLEALLANIPTIPEQLRVSIMVFQQRFKEYWERSTPELSDILSSRQKLLDKLFDKIYMNSVELLGHKNKLSDKLMIYVVGGLATEANGTEHGYHCYIRIPDLTTEKKFLRMVIHEYVGHEFSGVHEKFHKELFGKIIYKIDEGFAKFISNRILEKTLEMSFDYIPFGTKFGVLGYDVKIATSYGVFNGRKGELDQGKPFEQWYKECLTEIKNIISL